MAGSHRACCSGVPERMIVGATEAAVMSMAGAPA
jgi:hypothetical protein